MKIVLSILLIIIITLYDAYTLVWALNINSDQKKSKKANITWHWLNALLRIIIVIVICTKNLTDISFHSGFMALAILLIMWMPFDCIINFIRFRKLFYDGKKETGTVAITDVLLDGWIYYAAQIFCFIIGILILIIMK